jgi:hypothetical protein
VIVGTGKDGLPVILGNGNEITIAADGERRRRRLRLQLPRTVFVDNSTTPVTFWVGSNRDHRLVQVEPLD